MRLSDHHLLDAGWMCPINLPELDPTTSAEDRIRTVAATDFSVLGIPADFGGGGGRIIDVASAQRELARRDAGVAIALNMHSLSIGLMCDYWKDHRDTSWLLLEGLAEKRALVASAFAEPGGNGNFMRSRSIAEEVPQGYVINGLKFPCSLASTAAIYCMSAAVKGSDDTIIALCPANAPGIRLEGEWNSLGMHDSDTGGVRFENVELDRRLVFHRAPAEGIDNTVAAGVVWFVVLVTATYHGILTEMISQAAEGIGSKVNMKAIPPRGRRTVLLGEATREVYILGAACQRLATSWQEGLLTGDDALAAAFALRAALSRSRDRTVQAITEAVGSRVYTVTDPLSQAVTNSMACHHHPPGLLACDLAVGGRTLGQDLSFDPE